MIHTTGVVIEFQDQPFHRWVVSVENADDLLRKIRSQLAGRGRRRQ